MMRMMRMMRWCRRWRIRVWTARKAAMEAMYDASALSRHEFYGETLARIAYHQSRIDQSMSLPVARSRATKPSKEPKDN